MFFIPEMMMNDRLQFVRRGEPVRFERALIQGDEAFRHICVVFEISMEVRPSSFFMLERVVIAHLACFSG